MLLRVDHHLARAQPGRAQIIVKQGPQGGFQGPGPIRAGGLQGRHLAVVQCLLQALQQRAVDWRLGRPSFDDTDLDAGNNWPVSTANGRVTWTAPAAGNTLDWGTLYHFEFTANVPPVGGAIELVGVATASEPAQTYTLNILVPQGADTIFINGFD